MKQTLYKKLGWRRKMSIVAPIISRLTFGLYSPKLEKVLMWFDHRLNRYLTARHAKEQKQQQQLTTPPAQNLVSSPANR